MSGSRDPTPVRWPFAALAYFFVGVAFIGVVVPGLPTVPFLLLAAWAASRGSRRLHDWLYRHPRFGPSLAAWRDERAISRRSKVSAVVLLLASWLLLLWQVGDGRVLFALALLFTAVSAFLLSRPEPSRQTSRYSDGPAAGSDGAGAGSNGTRAGSPADYRDAS